MEQDSQTFVKPLICSVLASFGRYGGLDGTYKYLRKLALQLLSHSTISCRLNNTQIVRWDGVCLIRPFFSKFRHVMSKGRMKWQISANRRSWPVLRYCSNTRWKSQIHVTVAGLGIDCKRRTSKKTCPPRLSIRSIDCTWKVKMSYACHKGIQDSEGILKTNSYRRH
jgi:hypothetical protein